MLTFDGANTLDTVGPIDVLTAVHVVPHLHEQAYVVDVVSLSGGLVTTKPANVMIQTKSVMDLEDCDIHILLVAGGQDAPVVARDPEVRKAVAALSERSRYVASICTGAFVLAAAGLLKNRRAATHWNWVGQLKDEYPDITVEPDKIFVQDENVFSSAGITAGMDLALALVENDFGSEVALSVAQYWVMYLKRQGGQSQFSSMLPPSRAASRPFSHLIAWMLDNLSADLTVDVLAEKCSMSSRNFARRFSKEIGHTPSKYVELMRLNAARRYLENTELSLDMVASSTGLRNADRMRRCFQRTINVSPQDYRDRFRGRLVNKEVHNMTHESLAG
ncbi:MAG: DJ-1/PfpI family protein [Rhodobacteraceae bacterium]|nr:DJ-1/PfpI family protein [Paracoccaceae bacterium]